MKKPDPNASSPQIHLTGVLKIYRQAIKNVPLLRYSWVLIATICILSLTAYFKLKNLDVFFFAFAVIIISVCGFLLSLLLDSNDIFIKVLSYFLTTCIVITIAIGILGFGSFIVCQRPQFYNQWFPNKSEHGSDTYVDVGTDKPYPLETIVSLVAKTRNVTIYFDPGCGLSIKRALIEPGDHDGENIKDLLEKLKQRVRGESINYNIKEEGESRYEITCL